MLNGYRDIGQSGLFWCLRTVIVSVASFSPLFELHSYVRVNVAPATLVMGEPLAVCIVVGSQWTTMTRVRVFL